MSETPKAAKCDQVDGLAKTSESAEDIKNQIGALRGYLKDSVSIYCSCLRSNSEETNFGHFEYGGRLSEAVAEIDHKLRERARLTVLRDCFCRLHSSKEFVRELEKTAEGYTAFSKKLTNSCDDSVRDGFPFKAERFRDICQRAKAQLRHWSAIRQAIFADSFLCKSAPDLLNDLGIVKEKLREQGKSSVVWIGSILCSVIHIAEICQWCLSNDVLQSIFRGVEDYNRLCEYFKDVSKEVDSVFSLDEASLSAHAKMCPPSRCQVLRTHQLHILAVSLNKLLNGVAKERSTMLSRHLRKTLMENEDISGTVQSVFDWKDFNLHQTATPSRNGVVRVSSSPVGLGKSTPEIFISFHSGERQFVSSLIEQLSSATTLMLGAERGAMFPKTPSRGLPRDLPPLGASADSESGTAGHGILKTQSGAISPRLNKRVQWLAPMDSETKGRVCLQYLSMVWSYFQLSCLQEFQEPNWEEEQVTALSPGPMDLWPVGLSMAVVKSLGLQVQTLDGEKDTRACLQPAALYSLQAVIHEIQCEAMLTSFKTGYSRLVSTSLKDKSQPDGECTEGIPSTVTIMAAVALLDPLNSLFEAAQHWKQAHSQEPLSSETSTADKPRGLSLVTSLGHLQGLLEFCLSWLGSKLNTLLLTWNLKPFFLLTQWDMPCLVSSVERTAELLRPLCSSHSNVWSSRQMQWQDVQRLLGNLESLTRGSWEQFLVSLKKLSTEFFQEAMPKGKVWRKSRHGGSPFRQNTYAEHVVSELLAPVVVATDQLLADTQLEVLTHTVTALMTCWSDHILREEIIFSYFGAQQIQLDFNNVKLWIASEVSGLSDKTQSSLLSLDVFRHLDGATALLMLQPRKMRRKRMAELDVELESNMSAVSSSSVLSSISGADLEGYDLDVLNDKSIPNSDLWLALRLRGGKSKKGLMPFCLKAQ